MKLLCLEVSELGVSRFRPSTARRLSHVRPATHADQTVAKSHTRHCHLLHILDNLLLKIVSLLKLEVLRVSMGKFKVLQ